VSPALQADIDSGEITKSEIAATEKNTSKVTEHLKAAAQWTPDFAKSVGKDEGSGKQRLCLAYRKPLSCRISKVIDKIQPSQVLLRKSELVYDPA